MTRKPHRRSPESGGGKLLSSLTREEILEVLSEGFCQHCDALLQNRINNLLKRKANETLLSWNYAEESSTDFQSANAFSSHTDGSPWRSTHMPESVYSSRQRKYASKDSPASTNRKRRYFTYSDSETMLNDGLSAVSSVVYNGFSDERNERMRLSQVRRKKNFVHIERINGRSTNVLQGLELHTGVFNAEEQREIVEAVYDFQRMGQQGKLRARTYSEPRKWMRGKGRVTIQFGCCYNYAVDKNGKPPGIIRDEEVDPLPTLFKQMIKRMVKWHVLSPTCVPNSCIVNIYDEGDCIPPHIDHHDFVRPFCTVSFLTECNILFGSNLKTVDAGEFSGPVSIALPIGSVLVLNGNGADIAKHCVPAVPAKRISITFRKMDDSKLPYKFAPDPELLGINPLVLSPSLNCALQQNHHHNPSAKSQIQPSDHLRYESGDDGWENVYTMSRNSFMAREDDFSPSGGSYNRNRSRYNRAR